MQSEKIPSAILNAAALLLQPYLPDLTPQKLETALAAKEKRAGELDLSRKLTRAECARIESASADDMFEFFVLAILPGGKSTVIYSGNFYISCS